MSIARECFNKDAEYYILMHLELSATCQVALGVGISVTFLLSAIIFSLLASLITCLCSNKRGSLKLSTTSRAQEPVYADVCDTGTSGGIEMKRNAQVTTKAKSVGGSFV